MIDESKVEFARVQPARTDTVGSQAQQHWDMRFDGTTLARAEIFEAEDQWGVRLHDRAPTLSEAELLRLISRLLVWHAQCRVDTVDVVLARTHDHHTLVNVGGNFV